jgi:hypothetical protein
MLLSCHKSTGQNQNVKINKRFSEKTNTVLDSEGN